MGRVAKKKEYTVTVRYLEKTPEEAERLKEEQGEVLFEAKLQAMENRGEALPPGLKTKWV